MQAAYYKIMICNVESDGGNNTVIEVYVMALVTLRLLKETQASVEGNAYLRVSASFLFEL